MSYSAAKSLLTSTDISRILCVYFNSAPSSIDWKKATQDFGAPSIEAFRRAISRMLKKVEGSNDKSAAVSQTDISRILCVYFNTAPSAIDWAKATKDFGAPSVEAFRRAISRMTKKVEAADSGGAAAGLSDEARTTSPGINVSNIGKKRKAALCDESEVDSEETLKPKVKRARKTAKRATRR